MSNYHPNLNIKEIDEMVVPEFLRVPGAYYFNLNPKTMAEVNYWFIWIRENLENFCMFGKWDLRTRSKVDAVLVKMTWC